MNTCNVIGISDKIAHVTIKIRITPEYAYLEGHFHRLEVSLSVFGAKRKKNTASSDIRFLNLEGYLGPKLQRPLKVEIS